MTETMFFEKMPKFYMYFTKENLKTAEGDAIPGPIRISLETSKRVHPNFVYKYESLRK